jgi:6-phosphogluconolactonase
MNRRKLLTTTGVGAIAAALLSPRVRGVHADVQVESEVAEEDLKDLRSQAVFTMSNDVGDNKVVARYRDTPGLLIEAGQFSADGAGTGAGLGNQAGIVLAKRGTVQYLLTISAGSDEISSFRVNQNSLTRIHVLSSGGDSPVSLAEHNGRVCVVHMDGTVKCFKLNNNGTLALLAGGKSIGAGKGPAQIAFVHPTGQVLAITAKATNEIITLFVNPNGSLNAPMAFPSAGMTPFGFCVWGEWKNLLAVSNAEGGVAGASTVSSYIISPTGVVTTRSAAIPSRQSAACWLVCSKSGTYGFVSNAASGTISTYNLDTSNGFISLKAGAAVTVPTDVGGLNDMALSKDGALLYVRQGTTLAAFEIGDLTGFVGYSHSHILNTTAFTGGVAAQ